jgi:hypothetical protein
MVFSRLSLSDEREHTFHELNLEVTLPIISTRIASISLSNFTSSLKLNDQSQPVNSQ